MLIAIVCQLFLGIYFVLFKSKNCHEEILVFSLKEDKEKLKL